MLKKFIPFIFAEGQEGETAEKKGGLTMLFGENRHWNMSYRAKARAHTHAQPP